VIKLVRFQSSGYCQKFDVFLGCGYSPYNKAGQTDFSVKFSPSEVFSFIKKAEISLRFDFAFSTSFEKEQFCFDVPLPIIGGEIYAMEEILGPTQLSMSAGTEFYIDPGVGSATPMVHFGFSQSNIDISASAEFCVTELCANVGLSFMPDWGNGTIKICGELPIAGEVCI
jgi:hypothetical protein